MSGLLNEINATKCGIRLKDNGMTVNSNIILRLFFVLLLNYDSQEINRPHVIFAFKSYCFYASRLGNSDESRSASGQLSQRGFSSLIGASTGNAYDEVDSFRRPHSSTPVFKTGAKGDAKGDVYSITPVNSDLLRSTGNGSSIVKLSDENLTNAKISFLKSHRRNRSLDVNVKLAGHSSSKLDSQEYDIISDSELPSSLDQCSDEYLVVDGLIGQTVGSFTPSAPDENSTQDDPLFHVRLGLFHLLQDVLTRLPDHLITRIFGTILKVEHLLVLVNQDNTRLREIAVKVCFDVIVLFSIQAM